MAANAVDVQDLYEAQVPVADQGDAQRTAAIGKALDEVLVRVSGTTAAKDTNTPNPGQYVQQYRYRHQDAQGKPQLSLWVRFEERSIKQLLHERNLPIWGAARPLTLVWLGVEQGGQRLLVGANDTGRARDVLLDAGKQRGLPIRLPLLDLTDQATLRPADIWGGFRQTIVQASNRYAAQAILAGRLFPESGGRWGSHWVLYSGSQTFSWDAEGGQPDLLLQAGIDGAADRLSQGFSQLPEGAPNSVVLNVSGITDLASYRRVLSYLQAIDSVSQVRVSRVDAQTTSFDVVAKGSTDNVLRALALGDTLSPEPAPVQVATGSEQGYRGGLPYRVVP